MTREEILIRKSLRNGKVFTPFVEDTDIAPNQKTLVTAPMWSNSNVVLTEFFVNSSQSENQTRYYYEIFNSASNEQGAQPQFSIAYGDALGSGSSTGSFGQNLFDYPTKAIYSQYRQLLLPPGQTYFTFANGETSDYVYIININRSRFKDRVDTNNWQLGLGALNSLGYSYIINAANLVKLIDDSDQSTTELVQQGGRVYNVRSGSLEDGIDLNDTTPWGLFYPDHGIIVLNGKALDASASFYTPRSPATGSGDDTAYRLFNAISGANAHAGDDSMGFFARTSEVVSSTVYFVRIFNGEYNYSTNKSFTNGNTGVVKYDSMVVNPQVYITTIGLYNDEQELLAVAKLNKAIPNNFSSEISIKIKLDY
jgi:hypothetical protein